MEWINIWTKEVKNGQVIDKIFTVAEIEQLKQDKIKWCKTCAAEDIDSIAPLWKQLNLMRENGDSEVFMQIDIIRNKSNDLEKQIISATTVDEINEIKW